MGDLFGKWVPGIWIQAILHVAHKNPQHTFQFLTKNPERYKEFEKDFSSNCWLGTTIEGGQWTRWDDLLCVDASVRFVSMEPLLSFDFDDFQYICETGVDWVIVGAQTNPYRQPKKEWIKDIIYLAKMYGIPLFLKNNLNYKPGIQEFPQMGVKR
jgi:protein gp37